MKQSDFVYTQIFNRFGNIKRARGPFLYTAKGTRLTDLYQENGRAILGWGSSSAFTMMKNVINRGLTGSYNTDHSYRIQKAVSTLFNSERKIYIFASRQEAIKAATVISDSTSDMSVTYKEYRPWTEDTKWYQEPVVLFEPTLAWTEDVYILCVSENITIADDITESFETKRLNGAIAEAISRSIYNLIAALQVRQEKEWFIYDKVITKYWTRKGPYLYPKVDKSRYNDFILHCLDCNLVINPDYDNPSIVPYGADFGVFRMLERNPF